MALELRQSGVSAQFDVVGRSVKAQMKYADKIGARYTAVIGDDDITANKVRVKNMESGDIQELSLDDFADTFMEISLQDSASELQDIVSDGGIVDASKFLGGLM